MTSNKSISKTPKSAAERKRLQRARATKAGMPNHDQVIASVARAAIEISRQDGTLDRLTQMSAQLLEDKGFERSRSTDAIRKLTEGDGAQ